MAEIADATGVLTATWFSPYVAKALHPGDQVASERRDRAAARQAGA